jgi:hypothetical protein
MTIAFAIWNVVEGDAFTGLCWVVSAVVWLLMSFINYNDERIKLLEKKAEKYDALSEEVAALAEALRIEINQIDRD